MLLFLAIHKKKIKILYAQKSDKNVEKGFRTKSPEFIFKAKLIFSKLASNFVMFCIFLKGSFGYITIFPRFNSRFVLNVRHFHTL
jgi:hypothetical protein